MEATPGECRKRICIVGGGAAGMACAWSLSRHASRYFVKVYEKEEVCGGVATSIDITDENKATFINDGVQGAAPSYSNTLLFHKEFGFKASPVNMIVSFGKGKDFWTNRTSKTQECSTRQQVAEESDFKTPLIDELQPEIERFGKVLQWVYWLEYIFAFVPVWLLLSLLRFSSQFRKKMVYPLIALFFGTGNQTPRVSAAIVARVFMDKEMKLFDYDSERLLSQQPKMFAFDSLRNIYCTIAEKLDALDNVQVCCSRGVESVGRLSGGKVRVVDCSGVEEEFDHVVFACDAESVLRVHNKPTLMESFVLGNVQYFSDVTITHRDVDYMKEHYEINDTFEKGKGDQYYIYTCPEDPSKIEMSFNLSNYQPQLRNPLSGHYEEDADIYQSIFLDKKESALWTRDKIRKDKIIATKWWRQMAHTWKHFALVVPFVQFIQGTGSNTWYCGSYTMFNIHEMAITSGFAVADRLGAPHPFPEDQGAVKFFKRYMEVSHGLRPLDSTCMKRTTSPAWKAALRVAAVAVVVGAGAALVRYSC